MTIKTELLEELRRLASEQGPNITLYRFREQTGVSRYQVYDRWGNWTNLRRAAGLPPRVDPTPVYSDDELWSAFHRTARLLGHFPTCQEFSRLSEHSWSTLDRRFGRKFEVIAGYHLWLERQPADLQPESLSSRCGSRPPQPPAHVNGAGPARVRYADRATPSKLSPRRTQMPGVPPTPGRPRDHSRLASARPVLVLLIVLTLTWLSSTWATGAVLAPVRNVPPFDLTETGGRGGLPLDDAPMNSSVMGDAPGARGRTSSSQTPQEGSSGGSQRGLVWMRFAVEGGRFRGTAPRGSGSFVPRPDSGFPPGGPRSQHNQSRLTPRVDLEWGLAVSLIGSVEFDAVGFEFS